MRHVERGGIGQFRMSGKNFIERGFGFSKIRGEANGFAIMRNGLGGFSLLLQGLGEAEVRLGFVGREFEFLGKLDGSLGGLMAIEQREAKIKTVFCIRWI